jgi:hypothetical protein
MTKDDERWLSAPEAILSLTRRNLRSKIYKSMVPPKPADEAELATVSFRLNIPLYIISPKLAVRCWHTCRHGFHDSYRSIYVAERAASWMLPPQARNVYL